MTTRWYHQLLSVVLVLALLMQLVPMQALALSSADTPITEAVDKGFTESEQPSVTVVGEIESLRTETEKHFRLSDGTFIAVSYGIPVHYQDDKGNWQDIDNTLTLSAGQSSYSSANTQISTTFSANLSTGRLLTSSRNGVSVTMSLPDSGRLQSIDQASLSAPQQADIQFSLTLDTNVQASLVSGVNALEIPNISVATNTNTGWKPEDLIPEKLQSSILYEDVYPDVDLLYTAYSNNVKEQIIVKAPKSSYQYNFFLQLDGLTAILNADNSISLVDSDGCVCYSIPAPFMEDSVGATSTAVTYTMTQANGGTLLTVEADANWINDENRVFPVSIDPSLEVDATANSDHIYATYVTEGLPDKAQTSPQTLYFGYGYPVSIKEQRIFMHFNRFPAIPENAIVTDAQLSMYMFNIAYQGCTDMLAGIYEVTETKPASYSSYQNWINSLSWNTQPAYNTSNLIDYTSIIGSLEDGQQSFYYNWDLTELVKKWYDEDTENRTIAMAIHPNTSSFNADCYAMTAFTASNSAFPLMLIVSYRNQVGIEDYYSYATLSAGAAGTAYVSDSTGHMTIVKNLVSYGSSVNPFTIDLVYNSINSPRSIYDTLGLNMDIGGGWSLNVIQRIKVETVGGTSFLKYIDGDGTSHYLREDSTDLTGNTYYDESGLGLSLVMQDALIWVMSDLQGNAYTFTNQTLTNIRDNNGNAYNFNFANSRLATITQKNNGATEEKTIATFAYTENVLTSITDAGGIVYTFNYTGDNLTTIAQDDTVIASYVYNGNIMNGLIDSESGYTVAFGCDSRGQVGAYTEMDENRQKGAEVSIVRNGATKTTYRDFGNDRTKGTADDIYTHYLFDNCGRTVNAYSTDANGNILGASNAVYFDGSDETDKRNNRTIRTSSIGVAAEQELLNSSFEDRSAQTWTLNTGSSISAEKARTGSYSLRSTGGNDSTCAYKNSQTLYSGRTYTLSGYVNTTQMTPLTRSTVYLSVQDTEGNSWSSDHLDYITSEAVDDGWIRISMTFTAEVTGVHTIAVCRTNRAGTIYFDDLQLERGNAPSNRNLLESGNFQNSVYGWDLGGGHPTISYGLYSENDSTMSLALPGNPSRVFKATQTVPINLPGAETYVLSGWGMANAVPDNVTTAEDYAQDTEKSFGLRAVVNYSDGEQDFFYAPFDAAITDWQFTSIAIVPDATKTVSTITVECAYEKNFCAAYYDNISLVRQCVQSMRYDIDGNLEVVSTTGVATDTNTYENGNLIETVTGTNSTYSYSYDETYTHRLLSCTDGATTQSMTYDDYGNVTSSTFAANSGNGMSLQSSSTYSANGNLLLSSTDVNNITTTYQYGTAFSQFSGLPTSVTDANNTVTSMIYDSFGRTTQTSVANQASLSYNYLNGNLQSIVREDNIGNQQKYFMNYDTFGNMTAFAVYGGTIVHHEYGSKNGPLVKQTYGNGDAITYTYDNLGRLSTATYSDGRVVAYAYNGEGQLHSVRETGGDSPAIYLYTYDSVGNLISSEKKDQYGDTLMRVYQTYDNAGQLIDQSWYINNYSYSESYTYNTTNGSLDTISTGTGETLQFSYDDLQRLTSANNGVYSKSYSYRNLSDFRTTAQISQVQYAGLSDVLTYGYTYDAVGNIATYSAPGKGTVTYTYDALGQLISAVGDETYTYTYDGFGNILTANGHTYTYGATGWPDLLRRFDGESFSYDGLGNPTSYYNGTRWTFTWENGRSLATATDGTTNVSYAYDANGLRTSKTVGDLTYYYYYAGGQLLREYCNGYALDFFYDANGYPYAMKVNGVTYYYITNLQGDVMHMVDAQGNIVASYEYDPYGNILSATGTMANANPLRYRGYYYDSELGMYYLQSRYYDPAIGRFINADVYASTGQGVIGYNMFAYCNNIPNSYADYAGDSPISTIRYVIRALYAAEEYCSSKIHRVVKYDVPLYNQGTLSLCWAYCQAMFESWESRQTYSSWGAYSRAKEIAIAYHGKNDWNKGGWPSNIGERRNISNLSDLYYLVRGRGPVYAYYSNDQGDAHLVLVTGVNLDRGIVYTNNPWGVKGKQTFQQFRNGVAKYWYHFDYGMKLKCVYLINY